MRSVRRDSKTFAGATKWDHVYLVREALSIEDDLGVVPQAGEDGLVSIYVDVAGLVDLLRRQSSPGLRH